MEPPEEEGVMEDFPDRQKARPKHLERILLANHKEQFRLQRRLNFINNCSRSREKELDKERFKVSTGLQYTTRLNYRNVAPFLNDIPVMLRRAYPHPEKVDPVTVFLLREYSRNSQVIPDILATLQSIEEDRRMEELKRAMSLQNDQPEVHHYRNKDGEPDPHKLSDLVREIARIRNEIIHKNRFCLNRSRNTFEDLIRLVQDRDQLGSDSDTFTDGTCALLRRKMNKMRQLSRVGLQLGLEEDQAGLRVKYKPPPRVPKFRKYNKKVVECHLMAPKPPTIPFGRSHVYTGTTAFSRLNPVLQDAELRKKLEKQERLVTDQKVAREVEQYNKINDKIVHFLDRNRKKVHQLPPLFREESPVEPAEVKNPVEPEEVENPIEAEEDS